MPQEHILFWHILVPGTLFAKRKSVSLLLCMKKQKIFPYSTNSFCEKAHLLLKLQHAFLCILANIYRSVLLLLKKKLISLVSQRGSILKLFILRNSFKHIFHHLL